MSTKAAQKQLQNLIGSQDKISKKNAGSGISKKAKKAARSKKQGSSAAQKALQQQPRKSTGHNQDKKALTVKSTVDQAFFEESIPNSGTTDLMSKILASKGSNSSTPNFMELLAQVGKDLAAISEEQQRGKGHHGRVLQLEGVEYHPPSADKPLLQDISLELPGGTLGLVYGRSGTGKTTLLQLVAGLRDPTSGTVSIIDEQGSTTYLDARGRQASCGLVFQFPERHFIGTNLLMELAATTPASMSTQEGYAARLQFQQRLPQALAAVGMQNEPWGRDPSKLSDGYKRRLALAVQLVRQPAVLLLDEPLAGLDWKARKDLVAVLKDLKQSCSLLLVSHDLRELQPVVDCAWEMLPGGKLEARGKNIPVPDITM